MTLGDAALLAALATDTDPATQPVAVAVSGGGDSMALLDMTIRLQPRHGRPIMAVTLDHGLRPEAAHEAAMVAAFCANHAVPHTTLGWQGWDGGGNLQAEARAARYRLIGAWAQRAGVALVLLGHTQDDAAETFLMRLGRAAGLEGLSHMRARFGRDGVEWARPLMGCSRDALRAYLREHGVAWVDDPSNENTDYARVRARQALVALAPLGVTAKAIAQSAQALAQSRDAIATEVVSAWADRVTLDRGDLLLDLAGLPLAIQRRLLIEALRIVGGNLWTPRQSAVDDLGDRLIQAGRHTLAGCLITAKDGSLRVAREWQSVRQNVAPLGQLWDGRWQITGPDLPGAEIRALGQGIAAFPDWRDCGLPRASLMAGPAIWHGSVLIAAPLLKKYPDWTANLRSSFATLSIAH